MPHLDLGIDAWEMPLGTLEARLYWGRTTASDAFDDNAGNNHSFFGSLSAAYSPPFAPGLIVGANRIVLARWQDFQLPDGLILFYPSINAYDATFPAYGKDALDQRASVTAEWIPRGTRTRLYGEWAKNDYSPSWELLFTVPEHAAAFTIGAEHAFNGASGIVLLTLEHSELWLSRDYGPVNTINRSGTFYSHHEVRQGHTHEGQILGAGIGSGANAQYLGVRFFHSGGYAGGFIQRHARNLDVIYNDPEEQDQLRMNVEGTFGLEAGIFVGRQLAFLGFHFSKNLNFNWEADNDLVNYHFALGVQTSL